MANRWRVDMAIFDRWCAGDGVEHLAGDYGVAVTDIEESLRRVLKHHVGTKAAAGIISEIKANLSVRGPAVERDNWNNGAKMAIGFVVSYRDWRGLYQREDDEDRGGRR